MKKKSGKRANIDGAEGEEGVALSVVSAPAQKGRGLVTPAQ